MACSLLLWTFSFDPWPVNEWSTIMANSATWDAICKQMPQTILKFVFEC